MARVKNVTMVAVVGVILGGSARAEQASRDEVFEFTQKPSGRWEVEGGGRRFVVTFESKAACDATVAIVDANGKVVRHLASGVLGKNAPAPFKKDALTQALVWDGKDDRGKPANSEQLTVDGGQSAESRTAGHRSLFTVYAPPFFARVSLGLKATYDKSFADYFGFRLDSGTGLAVDDRDGTLYVAQNRLVRSFTRDGKYNRTVIPPQGGIQPANFSGRPWAETKDGEFALVGERMRGGMFLCFDADTYPLASPVVGPDGRVGMIWNRRNDCIDAKLFLFEKDGKLPKESAILFGDQRCGYMSGPYVSFKAQTTGGGNHHMAVSSDGEWLYLSGVGDAVLRYKWADLKGPRMPFQVFKGSYTNSGSDNASFKIVTGVACDAAGNVYVGDNGNDRIQVYKADGTYLRTLKVEAPHNIAVHPKTGEIYVLTWRSAGEKDRSAQRLTKLVKLSKDGAVMASMDVKTAWFYWHWPYASLALDAGGTAPALWLVDKDGIFKLEDKGTAFAEVLRLSKDSDKSIYAGVPDGSLVRAVVDPAREELYLGSGSLFQGTPWVRIDGRTGKIDPTFKDKRAMEMAMGPDGLIYARVGYYGKFVVRFTRDGQPVPFKAGLKIKDIFAGRAVGMDGDYTAIYVGNSGWSNIWQPGFDVSPNGDIVVEAHEYRGDFISALFPKDETPVPVKTLDMTALAKAPGTKPWPEAIKKRFPRDGAYALMQVWDRDGNEKCITAFQSPNRGSGIFVDAEGSLYAANAFSIPGRVAGEYESLKPGQRPLPTVNAQTYCGAGVLYKIGWKGGTWPLARAVRKDEDPGLPGMTLDCPGTYRIGGVTWAVQDVSDTFSDGSCGCGMSRFDLDGFARSWVPANHLQSVMVYDTNGNKITRIGRYGNVDNQGAGSQAPNPEIGFCWVSAVAASDEALYAVDCDNKRTLRAKLGYAVEESVALP